MGKELRCLSIYGPPPIGDILFSVWIGYPKHTYFLFGLVRVILLCVFVSLFCYRALTSRKCTSSGSKQLNFVSNMVNQHVKSTKPFSGKPTNHILVLICTFLQITQTFGVKGVVFFLSVKDFMF